MTSLQDQLLKAGLVDSKKAKKVSKEKRKEAKAAKHNRDTVDTEAMERERLKAEKIARDRELNKQRDLALQQKAISAQIKQLIHNHKKAKHSKGDELEYHFTDAKVIKKMRVDPIVNRQILQGQLAIVKDEAQYQVVPRVVAEKIQQRDSSVVLVLNDPQAKTDSASVDEDDPYKDYQIPDDLMW